MKVPPIYPHLISALDRYYGVAAASGTEPTTSSRVKRSRSTKELRILVSTFWKYPHDGGLSSYLTSLKAGLEKRGHRVDIVHPERFDRDLYRSARRHAKEEVERFLRDRYGRVNEHIADNLESMLAYEALVSARIGENLRKYDVIHAQDRYTANVLGRLTQSYETPMFFTPHGLMTHKRVKQNVIKQGSDEEAYFFQIDRRAIEVADKVVMLSETFRPVLTSLGAGNGKLETIYTGIEFEPGSKKTREDRLVISCVSRLTPRKGHAILLQALRLIRDDLRDVRVNIVGDGEMRDELEALASKLGLRRISFLGHRDDIARILGNSDIYVLPTTSDTLPISVIEAMFAGNAIVSTRCGGIPELVQHQQTGLLAEPGNVKELADCLLQLLRDRGLIKQLGRNAQDFAKTHLSAERMSAEIERVYRSVHAT